MKKIKNTTIEVHGTSVAILSGEDGDYISLTDMLQAKDGEFFISDWLRNRNTVEFLGIWESVFNPGFNYGEFATIKSQTGLNSYKLSVKDWVEKTNAIGLKATPGRYGGTFAHPDIAFEFGMWISPEFKIYLVKEFRRLKEDENRRLSLAWDLNRTLSKLNYRIHTCTGGDHLSDGSGFAQRRALWSHRPPMARCESQTGRERPRSRWRPTSARPGQPGRDERRIHSHGTAARRTAETAESNRHSPDAGIDGHKSEGVAEREEKLK